MVLTILNYYFIFVLILLFLYNILFSRSYLQFKLIKIIQISNIKIFFLNFAVALFFILLCIWKNNILNDSYENLQFDLLIVYKFFITFFCFVFLILSYNFSKLFKNFSFESLWLLMFSIFFLMIILEISNFLYFYVVLECYSLSIVSVLVLKKIDQKLLKASFNYLIINIFASCLLLYATSLIFYVTGTLSFKSIFDIIYFKNDLYLKNLLIFSIIVILIVFMIKLSIFPFSIFFVNIYNAISPLFTFFFLIIPKFSFSIFFYYNFLDLLLNVYGNLITSLSFFLLITSFIHAILSTKNFEIKELIINTSFSNVPFLLAPVFCKSFFLIASLFNFIIIYFLNLFLFFSIIFILFNGGKIIIKSCVNLYNLLGSSTILTLYTSVTLLSLASLPPFAGFFAKFFILYIFVEYKLYYIYIILSLINLFIVYTYLKIIKIMLYKKRNIHLKNFVIKKSFLHYIITFLIILNIFYILFFQVVFEFIFILISL